MTKADKGKKVVMSDLGKKTLQSSSKRNRVGVLANIIKDRAMVIWSGSKTPTGYHKDFIQLYERETT